MSITWKWRVASTGEKINEYRIVERIPEGERKLEDLGVYGRIILKSIENRCGHD